MKIGLIIYSHTGNTRTVAQKVAENLTEAGHEVKIEEIAISGQTPAQADKFKLTEIPAVEDYEVIILGAPVQAFALNPVMKAYLEQLPSLRNKKVILFVTKQLPMLWVGGTGAINAMKKACEAKEAEVMGSQIVVWAGKKRQQSIKKCVDNIGSLFT